MGRAGLEPTNSRKTPELQSGALAAMRPTQFYLVVARVVETRLRG